MAGRRRSRPQRLGHDRFRFADRTRRRATPFDGDRVLVTGAVPAGPATGRPWVLVGHDGDDSPEALDLGRSPRSGALSVFRSIAASAAASTSSGRVRAMSRSPNRSTGRTGITRHGSAVTAAGGRCCPGLGTARHDFGPGRVAWGPAGMPGFGVMPQGDETTVVVWEPR